MGDEPLSEDGGTIDPAMLRMSESGRGRGSSRPVLTPPLHPAPPFRIDL
jgi:hypothetical protein